MGGGLGKATPATEGQDTKTCLSFPSDRDDLVLHRCLCVCVCVCVYFYTCPGTDGLYRRYLCLT